MFGNKREYLDSLETADPVGASSTEMRLLAAFRRSGLDVAAAEGQLATVEQQAELLAREITRLRVRAVSARAKAHALGEVLWAEQLERQQSGLQESAWLDGPPEPPEGQFDDDVIGEPPEAPEESGQHQTAPAAVA